MTKDGVFVYMGPNKYVFRDVMTLSRVELVRALHDRYPDDELVTAALIYLERDISADADRQ